jgi:hypothetical protein
MQRLQDGQSEFARRLYRVAVIQHASRPANFRDPFDRETAHPFRCSPTSEMQWSVEPEEKQQTLAVNRQVGDAVHAFCDHPALRAPLLNQEGSFLQSFPWNEKVPERKR